MFIENIVRIRHTVSLKCFINRLFLLNYNFKKDVRFLLGRKCAPLPQGMDALPDKLHIQ